MCAKESEQSCVCVLRSEQLCVCAKESEQSCVCVLRRVSIRVYVC